MSAIVEPRKRRFTADLYERPSFSYVIDKDKIGIVNGHPYKGVVVAKLYGGTSMFAGIWSKRDAIPLRMLNRMADFFADDSGPQLREFVGVAYCSAEDEWDVEKGKKEARRKAWTRYYHCLEKSIYKCICSLSELTDEFYSYFENAGCRRDDLDRKNPEYVQKMKRLDDKCEQALREGICSFGEDDRAFN